MNTASVVVTCEVVDTLNHYKMLIYFFELCSLRDGGYVTSARARARASASTRAIGPRSDGLIPRGGGGVVGAG